ncbi:MAG: alpha/beta fold hydrolase [Chloroflexota bacterium]|nr:alpha/beta fold hydrolase [Chloroflexota bacterium]
MNKTFKNIIKGVLWTIGGIISAFLAASAAWIIYSRKHIHHDMKSGGALDAACKDFQSKQAGRISYYADTSGKGRPILLLHSVNAAASAFEIKPLFEHYKGNRPVYALDLPGFGLSDRADRTYSPILYQHAITEFIKDVIGKAADVVGLSLSCEFAALTGVYEPEWIHSLVMISPTGFRQPKANRISDRSGLRGSKNALFSFLSVALWNRPLFDLIVSRPSIQFFLNKSFEGLVPEQFLDYAYQSAHQPGTQYAPTYFLSGKLSTPAVRETVYKVLKLPVLVIYDRDPCTNFEMLPVMSKVRENWHAVRVSPTKGLPHWEQPEKTFGALDEFWSQK